MIWYSTFFIIAVQVQMTKQYACSNAKFSVAKTLIALPLARKKTVLQCIYTEYNSSTFFVPLATLKVKV